MNLTANIIGATGLVGKQLINLLLNDENFKMIRIFVRRDSGVVHPKLEQKIVDFRNEEEWQELLKGDVLFSALGTTLRQAGSKEKQYEIDYTFNLNFASAAKKNGIKHYVLVSSVGADSKSKIFYTRMKGELDNAVANLDFRNLTILRPSALTGIRAEKRITEIISIQIASFFTKFVFKKYRPIKDEIVAKAMINAVIKSNPEKTIWEADEVFELAGILTD